MLVILWSMVGHKVTAASQHLTEGSAACLMGLVTGLGLLVVHFIGGSGAALADALLEFNAGGFFTWAPGEGGRGRESRRGQRARRGAGAGAQSGRPS
jgi:hypothetical protein